jgi:hypothetical protein
MKLIASIKTVEKGKRNKTPANRMDTWKLMKRAGFQKRSGVLGRRDDLEACCSGKVWALYATEHFHNTTTRSPVPVCMNYHHGRQAGGALTTLLLYAMPCSISALSLVGFQCQFNKTSILLQARELSNWSAGSFAARLQISGDDLPVRCGAPQTAPAHLWYPQSRFQHSSAIQHLSSSSSRYPAWRCFPPFVPVDVDTDLEHMASWLVQDADLPKLVIDWL